MEFSKSFIRLNWIALVLIYLVVIAGSFVRITGSGMGCPDWPRCFGEWIPPTELEQLPENYQEIYLEKRKKKLNKFCKTLRSMGMEETAERLENDPEVLKEEDFNARKTWTEYVNRLVGFLAGNAMLIAFIWMLFRYRKSKIIWIAAFNLVLMLFQAWFGSIVVASNLVPWTITIHMFLALVIIGIQLYILYLISPRQNQKLPQLNWVKYVIWFSLAVTFYQMFLGTQVREEIDVLIKQGYGQTEWIEMMGMSFYIHRSFSWLVLVLLTIVAAKNERSFKYWSVRWLYILLALELTSGVMLAYAEMPGLVRTAHLVFASIIFGLLVMMTFRMRSSTAELKV
ncbi:MAG: COX15/CtaA family protein [Crocinitomicaceae bacterium]